VIRVRRRRRNWTGPVIIVLIAIAVLSPLALRALGQSGIPTAENAPAQPNQIALAAAPTRGTVLFPPTATPTALSTATPTHTPTVTPTPTPLGPTKTGDAAVPSLGSQAVVMMDADSGAILYQYNPHTRREPASVTKIMTAIIAIERGNLKQRIKADYDPTPLTEQDSSMMWINPGETVTLEDLLYGLLLPSGNDAAVLIAKDIAGSEEAFVALMNQKAQELGMHDTHYINPHGLHANGHYTTAYDLAILARYAMRNPTFREIVKAKSWDVHADDRTWTVYNLNKLLFEYPDADGIKIGYNDQAGKTIVGSVDHGGHDVFVVLLGSWDLWADSEALYDWAFANYTWPASGYEATPSPTPTPSP